MGLSGRDGGRENNMNLNGFIGPILAAFILLNSGCDPFATGFLTGKPQWQKISDASESHAPAIASLHFFDQSNGLASVATQVKTTSDGGISWKTVFEDDEASFGPLVFGSDGTGWVLGVKNKALFLVRTDDKGKTWNAVFFDPATEEVVKTRLGVPRDICQADDTTLWVMGDRGVLRLNAQKPQLSQTLFSEIENLLSISCEGENRLWAIGEDRSVHKYEDGWARMKIDDDFLPTKIRVKDNQVWVIGGRPNPLGAVVWTTETTAQHWQSRSPEFEGTLLDIQMQDDNQGWLIGTNGSIFNTFDGGQTWKRVSSPTSSDLITMFFVRPKLGWIGGDKTTVLRLSD
jgi:photosystem II stability/assembly factor-like uncharacterized protein